MSRHESIRMFDLIMRALLAILFNHNSEAKNQIFDDFNEFMEDVSFQKR